MLQTMERVCTMLESKVPEQRVQNTDVCRWRGACDGIIKQVAAMHGLVGSGGSNSMRYTAGTEAVMGNIMHYACLMCRDQILLRWGTTRVRRETFYVAFVALISSTFCMGGQPSNNLAPNLFGRPFPFSAISQVSSFDELVSFFNKQIIKKGWKEVCTQIVLETASEYQCTTILKNNKTIYSCARAQYRLIMVYACDLCGRLLLDGWDLSRYQKERFYVAFVAFIGYTFDILGCDIYDLAPTYFGTFHFVAAGYVRSLEDIESFFDNH